MDAALLNAITDLGDSALMLPLAVVLAALLWSQQSRAAALAWVGALLPGLAAVAAVKLAGHTCGAFAPSSLFSPSGHAALATMVYGAAGVVVARHVRGPTRWLAILSAAATAAAVAATRVLLSMHSGAEVAVGLAIGAATVALFAQRYRTLAPATFHARRASAMLAGTLMLLVALHGERLHAEELIRSIAAGLRTQVGVCP